MVEVRNFSLVAGFSRLLPEEQNRLFRVLDRDAPIRFVLLPETGNVPERERVVVALSHSLRLSPFKRRPESEEVVLLI